MQDNEPDIEFTGIAHVIGCIVATVMVSITIFLILSLLAFIVIAIGDLLYLWGNFIIFWRHI